MVIIVLIMVLAVNSPVTCLHLPSSREFLPFIREGWVKPRPLEANSKLSFEENQCFRSQMYFRLWDVPSCISHICVRKVDSQVWESQQMHQRYQEQQSNPRSTLEGNCMAGKQEDIYLVIPLQGHFHPHALQGGQVALNSGQIFVCVTTNKCCVCSPPSPPPPPAKKAQMRLRLVPRNLRHLPLQTKIP